ncbi:MAG: acyl dehydratase [Flavobacteriales bacterium]|nr:acyl dehydratase [Flavobacteriales bacterium]
MTNTLITKLSIDQLFVGMTESASKVITRDDVRRFSELSGDTNPIHLDKEYAKETRYKKNIAHGLMCASYFSGIFGTKLPGLGSIYVSQSLRFKRPIYIGDKVDVIVKITEIDINRKRVKFTTQCLVNSKICIDGFAEIHLS